jgi:transposase
VAFSIASTQRFLAESSFLVVPESAENAIIYWTQGRLGGYPPNGHAGKRSGAFALEDAAMMFDQPQRRVVGSRGELLVPAEDELTPRLFMIVEGECELGAAVAAEKYGYTRQRYYQLLRLFDEKGALALLPQKRGPKTTYVRTDELERQVIRHRFLDPDASADVIAQKLRQAGFTVSTRSVARVIEKFGLQKKTL